MDGYFYSSSIQVCFYWYQLILIMAPVLLDGYFYTFTFYVSSESYVSLFLCYSDHESTLIQNGGLLVVCCSTSHCV